MESIRSVARLRPLTLILWALVIFAAARFALLSVDVATRRSDGFAAYYTAARLLRDDQDATRFYDDDWFRARVAELVPGVQDIYNVNPPTTALLMLPLSSFDYPAARQLWIALNAFMLGITLALLAGRSGMRGLWAPAFLLAVLISQPLAANVRQGQAYILLLLLLTLTWIGWRERRPALLGITLGLALVLKTAGILLPILLVVRRRWSALGWCIATGLAVALGSIVWLGLSAWTTYLRLVLRLGAQPELSVTAYQSLNSLITHLFTIDAVWNPSPLVAAPALARTLSLLAIIVVVGITANAALRAGKDDDLVFAAFLTATIVLSPVSLDYHYTLLALPFGVLTAHLSRGRPRWPLMALGMAAFLVAADLPYRSPGLAERAKALLAYPKLYGALMLWATTVWMIGRESSMAVATQRTPLHSLDQTVTKSQSSPTPAVEMQTKRH